MQLKFGWIDVEGRRDGPHLASVSIPAGFSRDFSISAATVDNQAVIRLDIDVGIHILIGSFLARINRPLLCRVA